MPFLQDWIHKLEEGSGGRYLKIFLGVLALIVLVLGYNWRAYKNMNTAEAMDSAQVARNISEGRGFTTYYVRPFSMYLVKKRSDAAQGGESSIKLEDPYRIKGMHPDLANPPLYPCVLAGWMKVYHVLLSAADGLRGIMPNAIQRRLPSFNNDMNNPLWQDGSGHFAWHPDDFLIALLNQGLLLIAAIMTFFLARRLFDKAVAWTAALLLLACELLWRFSTSGLSTMVLLVIFLGLIWCLVALEQELRDPKHGPRAVMLLAVLLGLITGLGTLTRYGFGWLILPVIAFLLIFSGPKRVLITLAAFATFVVVISPWLARNYNLSGTLFGTAGYSIMEGTGPFPEHRLERSLTPSFDFNLMPYLIRKFVYNARELTLKDIPHLGGWAMPFFLVGLMLGFRNPAISRLRYFVLMCLGMLVAVQALGRTELSADSPDINSENLLVLLIPLVIIYATSLFYILLDQMALPVPQLRYAIIGAYAFFLSLPLISVFLPPKGSPAAYPPYLPPIIKPYCAWMKPNELMMSDIPWGVAWYGQRQCVTLTLDAQEAFFAINDYLKPVRALYLTQLTLDTPFYSGWLKSGERSWGTFVMDGLLRREIPASFPLRYAPPSLILPGQMFLTDMERWKLSPETETPQL